MEEKNKKKQTYIRLADQDDLTKLLFEIEPTSWVVCHFFRPGDKRCRQLENHLKILAAKHPETKFCALNAAKAPSFKAVSNMGVEIGMFRDKIPMNYILGYTELQNGGVFSTEMIENKLEKMKLTPIKLADQLDLTKLLYEIEPTSWVVCHFFRLGDKRCRQLENHLEILAAKHPEIKFCAVNAAKAPFFMSCWRTGVEIAMFRGKWPMSAIYGYTELQNGDVFSTEMIEKSITGAINYHDNYQDDLKEPPNEKPEKPKKANGGDKGNESNP